jgi:LacI family transcriptional regulator
MEMVKRLDVDGAVVREDEDIEQAVRAGIPVVTVNYFRKRLSGIASVSGDMTAIGQMGATHLLERGFRHFAYYGYTDRDWSVRREKSFSAKIARAGYRATAYMTPPYLDVDEWVGELEAVAAWLKGMPRPLGIMACNDDRGEQVIEACKMASLRVPDDVAVVGVDNDQAVCNFSNPRLSSVVMNIEDAGYHAAGILEGWMSGQKRSYIDVSVKPVRVATRESTDFVATDDKEVSDAMRFIRENASRTIQVGELAEHVGVSRRTLETRFRLVLGASVLDRIRSARVERAIMMLTDTNTPISEIANSLDYAGAPQFSRYFKQGTGMSPAQYRQQYSGK